MLCVLSVLRKSNFGTKIQTISKQGRPPRKSKKGAVRCGRRGVISTKVESGLLASLVDHKKYSIQINFDLLLSKRCKSIPNAFRPNLTDFLTVLFV